MKSLIERITPDGRLLMGLYMSATITIVLPLLIFTGARLHNDIYEDLYKEQRDQDKNSCGWWMYSCQANHQNNDQLEDGEQKNDSGRRQVPWWWIVADYERRRNQGSEPTGLLVYAYFLTIALMIYTIYITGKLSEAGDDVGHAGGPFMMLFAYSVSSMLYLGALGGAIADDGWRVVEHGWFGQLGVLVYMTLMCTAVFGSIFFYVANKASAEKVDLQRHARMELDYERSRMTLAERVRCEE